MNSSKYSTTHVYFHGAKNYSIPYFSHFFPLYTSLSHIISDSLVYVEIVEVCRKLVFRFFVLGFFPGSCDY